MGRILFFGILACILLQVSGVGQEAHRILKNPDGSYMMEPQTIEREDTGIRVETGLNLSSSQLDRVIKEGEIPLDEEKVLVGWDKSHTHLLYEIRSTKRARLDDGLIRVVTQETVTAKEEFNLFFIAAGVYIALMFLVVVTARKSWFIAAPAAGTAIAAAIAAAFAVVSAVAAFAVATAAFAVVSAAAAIAAAIAAAFAVVSAVAAAVAEEESQTGAIWGIILMVIASIIMFLV